VHLVGSYCANTRTHIHTHKHTHAHIFTHTHTHTCTHKAVRSTTENNMPFAAKFRRGQPDHCFHTAKDCSFLSDSHQVTVTAMSEITDTVHHFMT
jgi:hypothetical protein